jgi:hypothetical protein
LSIALPTSSDFGNPGPVQPRDRVADLEAGVLDAGREAVIGAGAAEREEVPAGLETRSASRGPPLMPRRSFIANSHRRS